MCHFWRRKIDIIIKVQKFIELNEVVELRAIRKSRAAAEVTMASQAFPRELSFLLVSEWRARAVIGSEMKEHLSSSSNPFIFTLRHLKWPLSQNLISSIKFHQSNSNRIIDVLINANVNQESLMIYQVPIENLDRWNYRNSMKSGILKTKLEWNWMSKPEENYYESKRMNFICARVWGCRNKSNEKFAIFIKQDISLSSARTRSFTSPSFGHRKRPSWLVARRRPLTHCPSQPPRLRTPYACWKVQTAFPQLGTLALKVGKTKN